MSFAAHLEYDVGAAWVSKSEYFGENETIADQFWEAISIDNGTVALDDAYAEEAGLPLSQRFPWDQKKGIYLLNGFHSMHCLVSLSLLNPSQYFMEIWLMSSTENYQASSPTVRPACRAE